MTHTKPSTLSDTAEKQLGSYALAALAGAGVLTTAQVAGAQVLTATATGQVAVNGGPFYLFANEGGFGANSGPALTLNLRNFSASSYLRRAGTANLSTLLPGSAYFAANLAKSTTVSAGAGTFGGAGLEKIGFHSVSSGSIFDGGHFQGQTGYLGIRFTDPTSGNTDYGWAEISVSGNDDSLTVIGAAYDASGAAIQTGQTVAAPEPGSLAMLAGGAGCLALWRRRTAQRKQAVAATTGAEDAAPRP